jgi:hypothetical protein
MVFYNGNYYFNRACRGYWWLGVYVMKKFLTYISELLATALFLFIVFGSFLLLIVGDFQ